MKKKNIKPISYYRKKADKILQEIGRIKFDSCLVCGGKYNCLHHFFTKASSSSLRYNWLNLINLCQSCHAHHHWGNPEIHMKIVEVKGQEWVDQLREEKNLIIPKNKKYYQSLIEILEEEKKKAVKHEDF